MPEPFYLARSFLHRINGKNSTTAPADREKEENYHPFPVLLWSGHSSPQVMKEKLSYELTQKQAPKASSHLKQDPI